MNFLIKSKNLSVEFSLFVNKSNGIIFGQISLIEFINSSFILLLKSFDSFSFFEVILLDSKILILSIKLFNSFVFSSFSFVNFLINSFA